MITVEKILSVEKDDLLALSKELNSNDLAVLVDWTSEKDDKIRYKVLLLLQDRIKYADDVYPYWDVFRNKLRSDNSYQRSIGLILIAGNVKWDRDNKFEEMFDEFFSFLYDEKPITVRQCIQSLKNIVPYTLHLNKRIAEVLINVDLLKVRETMRKLILLDIMDILILIRKYYKTEEIDCYISNALLGGMLDKKSKKNIHDML